MQADGMFLLVFRQLQLEPLRTTLTGLSLAAVVAVILIFEGFLEGVAAQSRNAVLERGADLIVTQAGIKNMTLARSILPQFTRSEVEAVAGVAVAHPLTGSPVIYEQDNQRAPLLLLVYDTSGGAAHLAAGSPSTGPREIVVDQSFADKFKLTVGDPLLISDFAFTISGIAEGAAAFFSAFGFARYDDLIDFYFESDLAADISTFPLLSFLLVEHAEGADRVVVAAQIERVVPSADVFTPEQLAAEDEALGRSLLGPIIGLLVAASYISGALVTAIIMFATANARRRDFGVLKALGFSHRFLSMAVVLEALALVLVALPLGLLLAQGIAYGIETTMPLYLIPVTEPLPLVRTAIACMLFAVVGALTPVRLIRRLDPSLVFRS
jgi:ABC-type antimicrobial peptide transport system permease subunit